MTRENLTIENLTGNQSGNVSGHQTGNLLEKQVGNLLGKLAVNVSGNQPGNVSGNQTGNLLEKQTGNLSGNQPGNLSGNQPIKNLSTENLITAPPPTEIDGKTNEIETETIFTCEVCHYTFNRKGHLTEHMLSHTDYRPYNCSVCQRSFKYMKNLRKHMKFHETPHTLHTCTLCDYQTRWKRYLKTHYIRIHIREYKLTCDTCGKKFGSKSSLRAHIKHHDREAFKCVICGNFCHSEKTLYNHMKKKHKLERDFVKTTCPLQARDNLNQMKKKPTMKIIYASEICETSLKLPEESELLAENTNKYKSMQPHRCSICQKIFKNIVNLQKHMKNHELNEMKDTLHSCDLCGYQTKRKAYLKFHYTRKHSQ